MKAQILVKTSSLYTDGKNLELENLSFVGTVCLYSALLVFLALPLFGFFNFVKMLSNTTNKTKQQ